MKEVLENSQSATLRSLFTKLHFYKENAEEICNHEMAMEALKIKMVFSSKYELYYTVNVGVNKFDVSGNPVLCD